MDSDSERLDAIIAKYAHRMPARMGRFVEWLRKPQLHWARLIIGVLLVLFGCVGFLPVLGFWMVPLGLILLAQDIAFLRRPTIAAIEWIEAKVENWKRRKQQD